MKLPELVRNHCIKTKTILVTDLLIKVTVKLKTETEQHARLTYERKEEGPRWAQ